MTAPRAERTLRRRRSTPTSTPAPALAVAAVSAAAVLGGAAPAAAAWQARASATSASWALASVGSRLDARTPAGVTTPQADPYTASSVLALGPTLVDAVNTSSVPARVSVTTTTSGLVGLVVTIKGCDVPWTAAGTCAAGETSVSTAPVVLGSTSTTTVSAQLPAGARRHLQLGTSTSLVAGASVVLRSSATPVVVPRDRTLG
ncbi:hypothetical protein [Quadrisphaera setariae]|uniref:Uncharacterized protein n=1 Tax=Quadrisphaera setariae TaxID=2593304 RepID=A0A5C8Z1W9_9ACTN|nr:hypothetical protein [Quadrisphaera setariae]TXR51249.1 hypothetical protein FMM08_22740 [Quadrisphaera setariae]